MSSPVVKHVSTLEEVWAHLTGYARALDDLLLAEVSDRTAALRTAFLPPWLPSEVKDLTDAIRFANGVARLNVPARVLTRVLLPADDAAREAQEGARGRGQLDPAEELHRDRHEPAHAGMHDRERERHAEQVRPAADLLRAWREANYDCRAAFPDQPGVGGTAVVILGDPGYGKSWLCVTFLLDWLQAHRQSPTAGPLPVRVPAARLAEQLDTTPTLREAVLDTLRDRWRRLNRTDDGSEERLVRVVGEAFERKRVLLVVDGWDEAEDTDRLKRELVAWQGQGRPLLLTSRVVGYPDRLLGDAPCWQLLAADDPEPLVRGWFGPDDPKGEELVQALRAKPLLGQPLRVPLLAAITCTLWRAGRFTLPAGRTELLDRMTRYLLTTAARTAGEQWDVDDVVQVLAAVAARTFTGERWVISRHQFRTAARAACAEVGLEANALFDRLIRGYGLFSEVKRGRFEIIHQSFAEYLCARGLAAEIGGQPDPQLVTAAQMRDWLGRCDRLRFLDPRLQEVWCHLAGLLTDEATEPWVELLLDMHKRKGQPDCDDVFDAALCLAAQITGVRSLSCEAEVMRTTLSLWRQQWIEVTPLTPALRCLGTHAAGILCSQLPLRLEGVPTQRPTWILEALGDIGPAAAAAVPALLGQLTQADRETRWAAASALGRIGPAALAALLSLHSQKDPDLRCAVASALGRIGTAAVPALVPLLMDRSALVRSAAATALGGIGPTAVAAIPALLPLLSDEFSWIRRDVRQAIERIDPAAIPDNGLMSIGWNSKSAHFRLLRSLRSLGAGGQGREWLTTNTSGEMTPSDYLPFLSDRTSGLQSAAAEALGEIGPAAVSAVPSILPLLADTGGRVRKAAAEALKRIGLPATVRCDPVAISNAFASGIKHHEWFHAVRHFAIADRWTMLPEGRVVFFPKGPLVAAG